MNKFSPQRLKMLLDYEDNVGDRRMGLRGMVVRAEAQRRGQGGAQHGRWRFTLYGERGNNEVTSLPMNSDMGFTGHYQHVPSGLVLSPYRAYDPKTARWLSRDPIGEAGGINLYGYVLNNPVNLWDPLGWEACRIGDAEIDAELQSVFERIEKSNVEGMSFFPDYVSFMGTLDTRFAGRKNDYFEYSGIKYPGLRDRVFRACHAL
jgi:RHS repeat-associated protein